MSPAKYNYGYESNLLRLHCILSIGHSAKYQGRLLSADQVAKLCEIVNEHGDVATQTSEMGDDTKSSITSKKLFDEASAIFGDRVFMHRTLPFSRNADICIARDTSIISSIKEAPIVPNSVSDCVLLSIRQGGCYADWRHTRHRYDNQVREQLLTHMGYRVEAFFWADLVAGTSMSLRRQLSRIINVN